MSVFAFTLIAVANFLFAILLNKLLRTSRIALWGLMISVIYNGLACGAYIDVMKRGKFIAWYVLPATGLVEIVIGTVTVFMVFFHAWIGVRFRNIGTQ